MFGFGVLYGMAATVSLVSSCTAKESHHKVDAHFYGHWLDGYQKTHLRNHRLSCFESECAFDSPDMYALLPFSALLSRVVSFLCVCRPTSPRIGGS